MTSLLEEQPTAAEAEPDSAGQVVRRRLRVVRIILLIAVPLILVSLLIAALKPRVHHDYLDPQSADVDGSRALAQIVAARGTDVRTSRNAQDAADQVRGAATGSASDTLLVVVQSDRLTLQDLVTLSEVQSDVLLVDPTRAALDRLGGSIQLATQDAFPSTLSPGCPDLQQTGSVSFGPGSGYAVTGSATGCFRDGPYSRLVHVTSGGRTTTVLGSGDPFTNGNLAKDGNAALGIDLAAGHKTLVWLIPDLPKPGSGATDKSLEGMYPSGVGLMVLELLVTVALVAAWRMRRFGPIVMEKLPVAVRSAETVEGRARLYRGHRARDRAAGALRAGTLERLVPRLGLPRSAAQDPTATVEIIRAVRDRSGWDETTVGWSLYGPAPVDDAELVRLSDLLSELEKRVLES